MRFSWQGYQLCLNNKNTLYGLRKHVSYDLFYIYTPEGDSSDFYNKQRAKEHVLKLWRQDNEY